MKNKGSSSTSILVIILLVITGFVVWYITKEDAKEKSDSAIEMNLGSQEN
ncbi:MAG: hypothetical protein KBC11_00845 [Candidatus Pacebacteria bacterium]|nr:hypothetical protein [Candidatus Paceibacterota bacterium]